VSQKALAIVIIIIIGVGIPWASRTSLRSSTTSATATSSAAAATAVVSTPVVVVSVIVEVIVERVVVKIVAIVAIVTIVITIPTTAVVRVEIIVVSGIAIVKSGIVGVVVIVVIEVVVIVVVVIVEVVSGIAIIVVFSWASRSSLSASGRIVSRSTSNVKIAITCVIREIVVGGVAGAIAGRTVILPISSRTPWPPLAWFGIVGVSVGIVRRSCGVTLFLEFSRHLNFHVLPQDLKNFTSIHVLASNVIQVIGVFKYHKTVTKWTIASNHDLE
jgi:hypothetical protein